METYGNKKRKILQKHDLSIIIYIINSV